MDKQINLLLNERQELLSGLVETPAQTLHDYHRRVGEIQGIDKAIGILTDSLKPKDEE